MIFTRTKVAGVNGFAHLLRAEWSKFRSARGLVIGMVVAVLVTVLPGLLLAASPASSCQDRNGHACAPLPVGPDGEAVADKFFFVHKTLTGNGSITARVTSLTGLITYPPPSHDQIVPGVVPWAKAGVMIKNGVKQGAAYAGMMVTGSHGVRMQSNFTEDAAGRPGGVSMETPRWLRLTRTDDTLIGYESTDGIQWSKVDTVHLAELPVTVQVGLFVTSPGDLTVNEGARRFTNATSVFDHLELQGEVSGGAWNHDDIGSGSGFPDYLNGKVQESGNTFTVSGSGDIAPLGTGEGEGGWPVERFLIGVLTGLLAVIVVAALFAAAEYGQRISGETRLANHQRGRVLAAKAVVIGTAAFVAGLAAAIVAVPLCRQILLANGNRMIPVTLLTELRVMFGTAAILAVIAVFAVTLAALFRRSVAAVASSIAVIVLPYILANMVPTGASKWLLRLTPAAGFAIQQSIPEYPQVIGLYVPQMGYYPLTPWAGFAVLCGYTALAFGFAIFMLKRRGNR